MTGKKFKLNSSSLTFSSFGFFLFGVATAQQYSPFHLIDFISFPSSLPLTNLLKELIVLTLQLKDKTKHD